MTVRERLEAMDELDRLSERMQTMPKKYPAASGSPERFEVRELQAEHRVSRMSNEIVLGGCTPTPLADYLKALGVLRLLTRSEEHTSELQSLMRISYAVFCLKKKK